MKAQGHCGAVERHFLANIWKNNRLFLPNRLTAFGPQTLAAQEDQITRIRREALPLRLIDIILLILRLDAHDHPVLGDTHVSLLHALVRLVRHVIRHSINGIADETGHGEKNEENQEGDEVREGGHFNLLTGCRSKLVSGG